MLIPRKRLYDVVHICKHLRIIVEENGQFLFQGLGNVISLVSFLGSLDPTLQHKKEEEEDSHFDFLRVVHTQESATQICESSLNSGKVKPLFIIALEVYKHVCSQRNNECSNEELIDLIVKDLTGSSGAAPNRETVKRRIYDAVNMLEGLGITEKGVRPVSISLGPCKIYIYIYIYH